MPKSKFQESIVGPPTVEEASQSPVGLMREYAPEKEGPMSWTKYKNKHSDFVGEINWENVVSDINSIASEVKQDKPSIYILRPR
jgi:hypothetical protein